MGALITRVRSSLICCGGQGQQENEAGLQECSALNWFLEIDVNIDIVIIHSLFFFFWK
jgi:hypothetical protein